MLQYRAMTGDYSWSHSAEVYLSLYRDMLEHRPTEAETPVEPKDGEKEAPEDVAGIVMTPEAAPVVEAPIKRRSSKPKAASETTAEEPVKKPRGRKPKAAAEAPAEPAEAPKKRGRQPKAAATEAPSAEEAPVKKPRSRKPKANAEE